MSEKCELCRKELGDKMIERSGKKFCCEKCMHKYGEEHPPENPNTCEFC